MKAGVRLAAALAAAALALTGCGAGQVTQTADTVPAITGVDVDAGSLALRDLQVEYAGDGGYPEGGQAPLRVWIANEGQAPVALTAVTSPAAESVVLDAADAAAAEFPIVIAPDAYVRLSSGDGPFLVLEGLTQPVSANAPVEVSFTFDNGEVVTANLPLGQPEGSDPRSYYGGGDEGH